MINLKNPFFEKNINFLDVPMFLPLEFHRILESVRELHTYPMGAIARSQCPTF